ncbi:hypothetical protein G4B88_019257 [Cannabis sativa]|uniref:Uncharacterized protein n=1 Tax=Cannabis sativa TaxID=3483 RepID=A0A7J6HMF6_CANSA|nr:hypothetical protein G4B88_019257 [Cannabis sativa]
MRIAELRAESGGPKIGFGGIGCGVYQDNIKDDGDLILDVEFIKDDGDLILLLPVGSLEC